MGDRGASRAGRRARVSLHGSTASIYGCSVCMNGGSVSMNGGNGGEGDLDVLVSEPREPRHQPRRCP
eukprot:1336144-Rhodomonas_salina.1